MCSNWWNLQSVQLCSSSPFRNFLVGIQFTESIMVCRGYNHLPVCFRRVVLNWVFTFAYSPTMTYIPTSISNIARHRATTMSDSIFVIRLFRDVSQQRPQNKVAQNEDVWLWTILLQWNINFSWTISSRSDQVYSTLKDSNHCCFKVSLPFLIKIVRDVMQERWKTLPSSTN